MSSPSSPRRFGSTFSTSVSSSLTPLMAPPCHKSPFESLLGSISPQLRRHTPNVTQSENSIPMPDTLLSPELCDFLSNRMAPTESDDPVITPFLYSAQKELMAYKSSLDKLNNNENALAIVQVAQENSDDNALEFAQGTQEVDDENNLPLVVQGDKEEPPMKRGRKQLRKPKELIRATLSSHEDVYKSRSVIRRIRIAYESLRLHYHHKFMTDPHVRDGTKMDRTDMKAFSMLRKMASELLLHTGADKRIVGSIPGVEIGDIFFYRAELCLLGLHIPTQAGIGYAPCTFVEENEPIAVSVVDSGGYEDNKELGEEILLYTGSGGKGRNDCHVLEDQNLERGNLALERSLNYGIEVRVIRGMPLEPKSSRKLYVYDGLYRVVEWKPSDGKSGCRVYQFKLLRIQGQPQLGSKTIRIAAEIKGKLHEGSVPSGYFSLDISNKKEAMPVLFFNDVDREVNPMMILGPMMHKYLKAPVYPSPSKRSAMRGCECSSTCSDKCSCKARNGGTFAYDNGVLLQGRPVIYECGDGCHCPATCSNRLSQKGIRYQLEVFRSADTYWGVRSLDPIQAGTFICEFSGDVILRDMVTPDSEYQSGLIDPINFPTRWQHWGDVSAVFPEWKPAEAPALKELPRYLLDVSKRNNVASYISHSVEPNTFIQFVLYQHDNVGFPRMAVFAMENIPPLRHITLDYGRWISISDVEENY